MACASARAPRNFPATRHQHFKRVLRKTVSCLLQAMKVQQFHRPTMRRHQQVSVSEESPARRVRNVRLLYGATIFGICHICGEHRNLSFEHVPPRAAFNPLWNIPSIFFLWRVLNNRPCMFSVNMTKSVHLLARKNPTAASRLAPAYLSSHWAAW